MTSYSKSKFEKSRAYLHEITYDDRVIRGVSHLGAMWIGIFSTAEALAKRKRILATFLKKCPCCGEKKPETIPHILVSCKRWDRERKIMMTALCRCLRKLKLEYRWLKQVIVEEDLATLLLGGAVADPARNWESYWGSGVQRNLGGSSSGVPTAAVEDTKKWSVRPLFFLTAIFLDMINVSRCASVWAHPDTTESLSPGDMVAQLGHVTVTPDGLF